MSDRTRIIPLPETRLLRQAGARGPAGPGVQIVTSILALKSAPLNSGTTLVESYYGDGGYGGGWFRFDAVSTETDDGAMVIQSDLSPTGRWLRIITEGGADLFMWGIKTDVKVAGIASLITAAIAWSAANRQPVYGRGGLYHIDTGILFVSGATLILAANCEFRKNFSGAMFDNAGVISNVLFWGGILSNPDPAPLVDQGGNVWASSDGAHVTVHALKRGDGSAYWAVGEFVALIGLADHAYTRDITRVIIQYAVTTVDNSGANTVYTITPTIGACPPASTTARNGLSEGFPTDAPAALGSGLSGNFIHHDCDDITIDGTEMREAALGSRALSGTGDRVRWQNCKARTTSQDGACFRFAGGNDFLGSDLHGTGGADGTFQFSPAAASGEGIGNKSFYNCHFVNCTGNCFAGNLFIAGIGGTLNCTIRNFSFASISGWAGGRIARIRDASSPVNQLSLIGGSGSVFATSDGTFITVQVAKNFRSQTQYLVGDVVVLAGFSDATYNATWTVQSIAVGAGSNPDTLTLTGASVPVAGSAGSSLVLGFQLLGDPDLDNTGAWTTVGPGWLFNGGFLTRSNVGSITSVAQSIALVAGQSYQTTMIISDLISGSARMRFGGGTVIAGPIHSDVGTFTDQLTAVAGNNAAQITGQGDFAGTIDRVTLRQILVPGAVPTIQRNPIKRIYDFVLSGLNLDGSKQTPALTSATQTSANGLALLNCHDGSVVGLNVHNQRGSGIKIDRCTGIQFDDYNIDAPRLAGASPISITDTGTDTEETTASGTSGNSVQFGIGVVHGRADADVIEAVKANGTSFEGLQIKDIGPGHYAMTFADTTDLVLRGNKYNGTDATSKGIKFTGTDGNAYIVSNDFRGLTCPTADKIDSTGLTGGTPPTIGDNAGYDDPSRYTGDVFIAGVQLTIVNGRVLNVV
jgi:hypothetical protein